MPYTQEDINEFAQFLVDGGSIGTDIDMTMAPATDDPKDTRFDPDCTKAIHQLNDTFSFRKEKPSAHPAVIGFSGRPEESLNMVLASSSTAECDLTSLPRGSDETSVWNDGVERKEYASELEKQFIGATQERVKEFLKELKQSNPKIHEKIIVEYKPIAVILNLNEVVNEFGQEFADEFGKNKIAPLFNQLANQHEHLEYIPDHNDHQLKSDLTNKAIGIERLQEADKVPSWDKLVIAGDSVKVGGNDVEMMEKAQKAGGKTIRVNRPGDRRIPEDQITLKTDLVMKDTTEHGQFWQAVDKRAREILGFAPRTSPSVSTPGAAPTLKI